jgi:tryptophanyl-tRNA synthetase
MPSPEPPSPQPHSPQSPSAQSPSQQPPPSSLSATQRAAVARSALLTEEIARDPSRFRVLSGDRPTGALHVGHYFGSLRNRVRLQDQGVSVIVLIADYQVLTDHEASRRLPTLVRELVLDYLAIGIDPSRSLIFTHSAVPALNALVLPFLSLVSDAELRRNPTVKAETAATGRGPNGLMLTYPVHQAADILFCRANLVPVGLDQLPHLEMSRLIARRFNERYADEPVFPEPDALLSDVPLLLGFDGQKMSKTRRNGIELGASEDETARLIRSAPTDSTRQITYDPTRRPAVANLLRLLAAATDREPDAVAAGIGDRGAGALKSELTDALNDVLRPIRHRRREFAADPGQLDRVLADGNSQAREIADATLALVHECLGMRYAL